MAEQPRGIRILPGPEARSRVGLKETAFCDLRKRDPSFPKPIPLGGKGTKRLGFVEAEIDQWLAARLAERDAA
jgi:prophage regulatory protein